jgi:hypothetical protein
MPLLVSILQGWSHICEIGKCEIGETLLTQCNSCARRVLLSANYLQNSSFSPLSFFHRVSLRIFCSASLSVREPFRGSCSCQKRLELRALKTFPMQSCTGLA